MATVIETKRVERAGVNAFQALMESARHVVQEINGGNDYGEDCYLSFTRDGRRTGDIISVQIKSGLTYRRAVGYAIPCRDHLEDWSRSRIPVIGVVYDPEMRTLHWVNMSEYIRTELAHGRTPRSVPVSEESILTHETLTWFHEEIAGYIESASPLTVRAPSITTLVKERWRRHRLQKLDAEVPIGGRANELATDWIGYLERHEATLYKFVRAGLWFTIAVCWLIIAPGLYTAGSAYAFVNFRSPLCGVIWIVCYYGFAMYLVLLGRRDQARYGRMYRLGARVLLWSGWLVAIREMLHLQVPGLSAYEQMYVGTLPSVVQAVMVLGMLHYIDEERSRRRRLKIAQGYGDASSGDAPN